MTAKKLRVGVIGAGVGAAHVEGYAALPNVEVLAIAGLDDDRVQRLAAKHGVPQTFREYTDLDGRRLRIRRATGLLGRALQHEIDHLDGVLFTERIRDLSTLKDYRNEGEPVPAE